MSVDGVIATITLNRPEKLNAMTRAMWGLLGDHIRALSSDMEIRCIIIRGAGGKAFSPGNDISKFEEERGTAGQAKAYGEILWGTFDAMKACPLPIVAMIQGICVGGGLEIAALCDIRICGASSRFGVPIKNLGLVMAYPEIDVFRQSVGRATALEMLLEGRIYGAEWAESKGIVHRVVADDEVEAEAYATATRIAEGAPLVARWHKKFLNKLESGTEITTEEFEEGFACYDTEDFRTGVDAFLAKKKPEFKGR